jgi:hypothetical protein
MPAAINIQHLDVNIPELNFTYNGEELDHLEAMVGATEEKFSALNKFVNEQLQQGNTGFNKLKATVTQFCTNLHHNTTLLTQKH